MYNSVGINKHKILNAAAQEDPTYENYLRLAEWIKEISEKIDVKLFKEALVICTDKGKLQFNFLKGIINNWLQKNVTSYEELKAFELQNRFTNSVSENNNNIQKIYKKGAGANVNNSFAGYAPDELEKILLESQKGKFD